MPGRNSVNSSTAAATVSAAAVSGSGNGRRARDDGADGPGPMPQLAMAQTCCDRCLELDPDGSSQACAGAALVLRGKLNWAQDQLEAGNRDFTAAAALEPSHPEVLVFHHMMALKAEKFYAVAKEKLTGAAAPGDSSSSAGGSSAGDATTSGAFLSSSLRGETSKRGGVGGGGGGGGEEEEEEDFFSTKRGRSERRAAPPPPPPPVQKDLPGAIKCLTEAIKVTPEDGRLLVMRASALRQGGHFEDALSDLERAAKEYFIARHGGAAGPILGAGPSNATLPVWAREPWEVTRQRNLVWNDMALGLMLKGHHGQALTLLDRVVTLEAELLTVAPKAKPDLLPEAADAAVNRQMKKELVIDPRFLLNRSDCHRFLGNLPHALRDLEWARASAAAGSSGNGKDKGADWSVATRLSVVRYELGVREFNKAFFKAAEGEFSAALELNPKVAGYWKARGEARRRLRDYSGCHSDLSKSLELDPSQADVSSSLAQQFEATHLRTLRKTLHRVASSEQAAKDNAEWGKSQGAPVELLGYGCGCGGRGSGRRGSGRGGGGGVSGTRNNHKSKQAGQVGGPSGSRAFPSPAPKALLRTTGGGQGFSKISAKSMQQALLPSLVRAEDGSRVVASARVEVPRTRKDASLWRTFKAGASGGCATSDGSPSKASVKGSDGTPSFLWPAVKTIQALEDETKEKNSAQKRRGAETTKSGKAAVKAAAAVRMQREQRQALANASAAASLGTAEQTNISRSRLQPPGNAYAAAAAAAAGGEGRQHQRGLGGLYDQGGGGFSLVDNTEGSDRNWSLLQEDQLMLTMLAAQLSSAPRPSLPPSLLPSLHSSSLRDTTSSVHFGDGSVHSAATSATTANNSADTQGTRRRLKQQQQQQQRSEGAPNSAAFASREIEQFARARSPGVGAGRDEAAAVAVVRQKAAREFSGFDYA